MKLRKYQTVDLTNILVAIVLVIVPFHAFLTVWGSSLVGHFTLLRLWDDILLTVLTLIVCGWLITDRLVRETIFRSYLFRLIVAYAILTLVTGLISYLLHDVTKKALAYDVLVNLRFLVWFIAVWAVSIKSSWLHNNWKKLIFIPLSVVSIFGLLQFFVLPHNFLSHFGYSKQSTFVPIITINQNSNTIRIQSFLRGANPLGAYLVAMISLVTAVIVSKWKASKPYLALFILTVFTLILCFSRSAWIGALVAIIVVIWLALKDRKSKKLFIASILIGLVILSGFIAVFHKNHGIEDAFLHVSSSSTATVTSNEGHASAIESGVHDIIHQPFGRGPGTAGAASWYNAPHPIRNSESYYLEIGQEVGWIGLILFAAINIVLGYELWKRRKDPLALGLLAALIGITIDSLFTYSWSDDTLAYIFWGLSGIAIAKPLLGPKLTTKKIKNNK